MKTYYFAYDYGYDSNGDVIGWKCIQEFASNEYSVTDLVVNQLHDERQLRVNGYTFIKDDQQRYPFGGSRKLKAPWIISGEKAVATRDVVA